MPYNPGQDFLALWRTVAGGVEAGEMPALDLIVAALGRAGLLNVQVTQNEPTTNQATTAWFRPAAIDYSAEGALYLWDATNSAYVPATPKLFWAFLVASGGG
jgi:hypothetical protein